MHILWLKTELLHPVDKGGRIRTYNMLRALTREHRITYLALDDAEGGASAIEAAGEYCHQLERIPFRSRRKDEVGVYADLARAQLSSLPYAIWKYRSAAMREAIARIAGRQRVDVVVCDFLAPAVNLPALLGQPVVLFQHNVEAEIWRRHADVAQSRARRWFLREQWRRMRSFEERQCRRFDHVVAVSDDDARAMRQYGASSVSAVPTGVDTEYFRPRPEINGEPDEIVFVGSMDWMPNEDAMIYFIEAMLPRIRARRPGVRLTIVGRRPTTRLLELAARTPEVTVTGGVPDVRPYLARASVVVVPLRVGGGTRLKIYEAMAMNRPVVSTTIGAEGLPLEPDRDFVVADEPAHFADRVSALLASPSMAATLGRAGGMRVRTQFGWDGVAQSFADSCTALLGITASSLPEFVS